jgi:hypothetical protein
MRIVTGEYGEERELKWKEAQLRSPFFAGAFVRVAETRIVLSAPVKFTYGVILGAAGDDLILKSVMIIVCPVK